MKMEARFHALDRNKRGQSYLLRETEIWEILFLIVNAEMNVNETLFRSPEGNSDISMEIRLK